MSDTTVHCPKCGDRDIREKNVAYASLVIADWDFDDAGVPVPADYDSDESADWETLDTDDQYVCYGCYWEGQLDQLVVRLGLPAGERP